MEELKLVVAAVSVVLALASFAIARRADVRSKKAEAIEELLGEKEAVAFAALKLMQTGFPKSHQERALVLAALMQSCLFCSSDRARSLLYRVLELNRVTHRDEMKKALQTVKDTFDSMNRYHFTSDELNLERGNLRISAVDKVVNSP
jgi:hypothetical protein